MATGGLCVEPSDMECTVCNENFKVPKLLPCGHLLCRHCLVTWLKSQPEASCPICRATIVDPQEKKVHSLDDIADSFPTDLAMEALVEADRVLSKQHVCCVCVNVAAVSMCVNCSDMFCQTCSTLHKKQSATKHHKVKDLTLLTPETLAADRPATCAVHNDEISKLYCPTHDVSICLFCATADHRQCPEVTKLETKLEESRAELKDLAAMLSKGETELNTAIAQLDKKLQDIDQQTKDNIAEMEATCDRLEASVKACRLRQKELAVKSNVKAKAEVNNGKTILLKRRGGVMSHKILVQRVQGFSKHGSFGDMTTLMKTRVSGLDLSATLPSKVQDAVLVTLTLDPEAVTHIEQELLKLSPLCVPKNCALRFHGNHGKKIIVNNDNQTAQRTSDDTKDGIVLSHDRMLKNMLYQVRIDKTNNDWSQTFLGVVAKSPDTLTLPYTFGLCDPDAVCVAWRSSSVFDKLIRVERPVLKDLPVGSQVGLAVHTDTSLHLYVNGREEGVIAPNIPDPCYFMFDLCSRCTKVTALPVRPIS